MEVKGSQKTTAELAELCRQLQAIDMELLEKVATPEQMLHFKRMRVDCGLVAVTMSNMERLRARR